MSTWTLALLVGLIAGLLVLGAKTSERRVWVVDETGFDCPDADFRDIQPAVDAASPGDTILVCPGLYSPVVVDKDDLVIVASEEHQHRGMHTIVHGDGRRGNVFTISADRVVVKGLWVTSAGRGGEDTGHGFFVAGSRATISSCTATLNDGDGIRIVGGEEHRVERCTLSYNGRSIFVAAGAFAAAIEDNQFVEFDAPVTVGSEIGETPGQGAPHGDAGG